MNEGMDGNRKFFSKKVGKVEIAWINVRLCGVSEFNGNGIHKPHYYFEIYLTFCQNLTIYLL